MWKADQGCFHNNLSLDRLLRPDFLEGEGSAGQNPFDRSPSVEAGKGRAAFHPLGKNNPAVVSCPIRVRSSRAERICGQGNSEEHSSHASPSCSTASSLPATPASEVAGVVDSASSKTLIRRNPSCSGPQPRKVADLFRNRLEASLPCCKLGRCLRADSGHIRPRTDYPVEPLNRTDIDRLASRNRNHRPQAIHPLGKLHLQLGGATANHASKSIYHAFHTRCRGLAGLRPGAATWRPPRRVYRR